MIDKVIINGQEVEITKDMFEMVPANFGDNEAISRPSLTFWQDARKRLFKNSGAVTGLVILCCIILMAIFAPMFSKFDYKTQNIRHTKVPPRIPILSSIGIMDGKNSDGINKWYKEIVKRKSPSHPCHSFVFPRNIHHFQFLCITLETFCYPIHI